MFNASNDGRPVGPQVESPGAGVDALRMAPRLAAQASDDNDQTISQVIPIHRFAKQPSVPNVPGLPPQLDVITSYSIHYTKLYDAARPATSTGMSIRFEASGGMPANDYETPVKAVIDYIETRDDLDPARIGVWGLSLGGYYAPRRITSYNVCYTKLLRWY